MIDPEFKISGLDEIKSGVSALLSGAERMAKNHSLILAAQTRKTARNSMKRRRGVSMPGEVPQVKTGALKNFIKFAWDEKRGAAIVGPERLPRIGQSPRSLEVGMATIIKTRDKNKNSVFVRVHLEPRPYMVPALEKIMTPANVKRTYEKSLGKFVKSLSKKIRG